MLVGNSLRKCGTTPSANLSSSHSAQSYPNLAELKAGQTWAIHSVRKKSVI